MIKKLAVISTFLFLFFISPYQAQVTTSSSGRMSLTDANGRTIEFDLDGQKQYSIPCKVVGGQQVKIKEGFISSAIKEQLIRDIKLSSATGKVVQNSINETFKGPQYRGNVGLMLEIIQGAGYYLMCDGKNCGDVKFRCRTNLVEYKLCVDTVDNNLYVAEIEDGKVVEIQDVRLGVKRFEEKPANEERYENAVYPVNGNTACDCLTPLPGPIAIIEPTPSSGTAPLPVRFDGSASRDKDGASIVDYNWNFGERGAGAKDKVVEYTFYEAGTYQVSLEVTDDEGLKHDTSVTITVKKDVPPDTLITEKLPCDTVFVNNGCCDSLTARINNLLVLVEKMAEPKPEPDSAERDFQLAGGPVFIQNDGQLLEYAMGLDIQIRYPFKKSPSWQFMMDGTYFPRRVANPLDDRPHLWSELRDNIDPITNTLPLHWRRGTRRATASFAIGLDYKPKKRILLKGLYFQGMFGLERTFNQIEASDPLKDPSNEFIGFDLDVFFIESRVGLRKKHLEVYLGGRFLEESRPFTLVLANPLGGSHHRSFDNTIHAGISVWY